jgi:outer membrane cobalamin receptor
VQKHLKIFGRVENLTNSQYTETLGFPTLDTQLYGGVEVSF